jgi:FimV-like protein
MLTEAGNLEKGLKESDAFNKYREIVRVQPTHIKALWKCSELSSRIGNREKDKKAKIDFFVAAKTYAETALLIDSNNSDANYAMSVALGYLALQSKTIKEKVAKINDVKKYADRAISLNSENARAWFVLGRWHFEVASLNLLERSAVKLFYGGLPKASFEEAISSFDKAARLDKYFVANSLMTAKTYIQTGDKDKAILQLNKVIKMPSRTEDDPAYKNEAARLLDLLQ